MRLCWLTSILVLLTTTALGSDMCIVWKDLYLTYNNDTLNNATTTLHLWVPWRQGWVGLSLGPSKSIESSQFMIIVTPQQALFPTNHSMVTYKNGSHYEPLLDQSPSIIPDNLWHWSFQLPKSLIDSVQYLHFARSFGDEAKSTGYAFHSQVGFKMNPKYDLRSNFESGWCDPRFLKLPGRLLAWNIYSFVVGCALYTVGILLCILWRDHPLIKARGQSLPIAMFCYWINLITDFMITNVITYEAFYYGDCYLTPLILYNSTTSCLIVVFFHFMRYIVMVNINSRKFNIIHNSTNENTSQEQHKLPLMYRFMNWIISPFALTIGPLIWLIMRSIVSIIILWIYNFQCGGVASTVLRYIFGVECVWFIFMCAVIVVWDILQNIRTLIGCGCKSFLFTNDHYYFRVQFLVLPIGLIWLLLWLTPGDTPAVVRMFAVEMCYASAIWGSGFLALVLVVIEKIVHILTCCKKKKTNASSDILKFLFDNEEAYDLLLEYSQHEWNVENVYFNRMYLDYLKLKTDQREKHSKDMETKFLLIGESEFEINCPGDALTQIREKIKRQEFTIDLWEPLKREVDMNLSDVVSRFIYTNEYKSLMKKMQLLGLNEHLTEKY